MEAAGYEVKRFQEVSIPNKDKDLLFYFLGLISTDGHLLLDENNKKYKTMLFTSNEEEKEKIISLVNKLFDYKASIREKKYGYGKKINYEIYISSKKLCKFLNEKMGFPSGSKSLSLSIPQRILDSKKKKILHYLRGVIDGDGSVIKTKKYSALKIFSGSEKFIKEIKEIFDSLGFEGKIFRERKRLWIFRIHNKKHLRELYPLIYKNCGKFCYKRKRDIWKQYI